MIANSDTGNYQQRRNADGFTPDSVAFSIVTWTELTACVAAGLMGLAISQHLIEVPYGNMLCLILWSSFSMWQVDPAQKPIYARVHLFCGIVFPTMLSFVSPYLAPMLIGTWHFTMVRLAKKRYQLINSQLGCAFLVFGMADLCIVENPTIGIGRASVSHEITHLLRQAVGGTIVGSEILSLRLLILTSIITVPLVYGFERRRFLNNIGMQLALIVMMSPLWAIGSPQVVGAAAVISASILVSHYALSAAPVASSKSTIAFSARVVSVAAASILTGLSVFGIYAFQSSAVSLAPRRILFVDSVPGSDSKVDDIAQFVSASAVDSFQDFQSARNQPRYDNLTGRLLPALGYQVDIGRLDELGNVNLNGYDLIVLICLQQRIPQSVHRNLISAVEQGATNLLIVGDHTDIGGIQAPFNDVAEPLGIRLNYDSVFPMKDWHSKLVFMRHPVNGLLPAYDRANISAQQISVGGSLSIDWRVAFPLLMTADGFTDRGTPNSPQIGGLGDMRYTENEIRGGQILAAERPMGKGTVIAFGDTAFLQNHSVTRNFPYTASLFEYLTRHNRNQFESYLRLLALTAFVAVFLTLLVHYSTTSAVLCVALILGQIHLSSMLETKASIICKISHPIILIDDSNAVSYCHNDGSRNISGLLDLLEVSSKSLILEANVAEGLCQDPKSAKNVTGLILIGQRSKTAGWASNRILEFIESGGRVLYAGGYFEARASARWLENLNCKVMPVPLGAGQNVEVADGFDATPQLVESWAMELGNQWAPAVFSFKRPVIAIRAHGNGKLAVMSDGYALLDRALQKDGSRAMNNGCYLFYSRLLTELFDDKKQ